MSLQRDNALTAFMQSLSIENFEMRGVNQSTVNNIIIGGGRYVLDIEELSENSGIILALFSKVPAHQIYQQSKQLLAASHYEKFLPMVVQVGLRGDDTLVLMVRVEQVWPEVLVRTFDLMFQLYAEIEA